MRCKNIIKKLLIDKKLLKKLKIFLSTKKMKTRVFRDVKLT